MKKRFVGILISIMMLTSSLPVNAAELEDYSVLGTSSIEQEEAASDASSEENSAKDNASADSDTDSEESEESKETAEDPENGEKPQNSEEGASSVEGSSDEANEAISDASDEAGSFASEDEIIEECDDEELLKAAFSENEEFLKWLKDHNMTMNEDGMVEYVDEYGKLWILDPNDPEFYKYYSDSDEEVLTLHEDEESEDEEILVGAGDGYSDPFKLSLTGKTYGYPPHYKTSNPDDRVQVRCGLDISYHQGKVSTDSFKSMKGKGIDFIFLRAGYTGYVKPSRNKDTAFENNISAAYNAGMNVGVYWFSQAITEAEADLEAAKCIEIISSHKKKINLPVVIDYEYISGETEGRLKAAKLSASEQTKIVNRFCKDIAEAGFVPMIYANKDMLTNHMNVSSIPSEYLIWLAHYPNAKNGVYSTDYSKRLDAWQFTSAFEGFGKNGKGYFENDRVDVDFWYDFYPFEPRTSTLSFDNNGGTGSMNSIEKDIREKIKIPECSFTKRGCYFKEWNSKADGKGKSYKPGDDYTFTRKSLKLYAIWEYIEYKITFDPNGGTTDITEKAVYYNNKPIGDLPIPTKTGKIFAGWYTEKVDGKIVNSEDKLENDANMTLYAHWEDIKPATITLNYNKLELEEGESRTLSVHVLPKEAVTVLAWESSNPDVATIKDCVITAKEAGNAIITVRTEDSKFVAECVVTVTSTDYKNETGVDKETFETPSGLWIADFEYEKDYTGSKITQNFKVYYASTLLRPGIDYKVTYKNNTNAGTATAVVTGKGSYSGKCTKQFKIKPLELLETDFSIPSGIVNKGKVVKPAVSATHSGKTLKKGKDFFVDDEKITEAGTTFINVHGKGNYSGDFSLPFTVKEETATNISKVSVKGLNKSYTLDEVGDKEEILAGITLEYKKETLDSAEYDLSLENCKAVGKGTLVVTPKEAGSFFGQKRVTFNITGSPLGSVVLSDNSFIYNGIKQTPSVTVFTGKKGTGDPIDPENYDVSFNTDRTKAGTVTVTVTGKADKGYKGKVTAKYKITPLSVSDPKISITAAPAVYTKGGATPVILVRFTDADGKIWTLRQGADYTVKYANNKACVQTKNPTFQVVGKGNFSGKTEPETFVIKKRNINILPVNCKNVAENPKKTGNYYCSKPVIYDINGKILKEKTDYTVTYFVISKNKNLKDAGFLKAGMEIRAEVKATDKNYTGTASVIYKVEKEPKDITKVSAEKIANKMYTGKGIEADDIKLYVTNKVGGKKIKTYLKRDMDFKVTGYYNNVAKGTASVRIEGIGEYRGCRMLSFKIVAASLGSSDIWKGAYKDGELVGYAPSEIKLEDETVEIGGKATLVPTFLPGKSDIPAVTWKSSNSKIASVDKNGVVTGKARGSVTITVTSSENKQLKTTATITVQ